MLEIINKALAKISKFDPQSQSLMMPIEGKSLTINITDIDSIVSLHIKENKLVATNDKSKNILSGKLAYILELLFNKNMQELIMADKLNYDGSLKDLKDFYTFFGSLDIDLIYRISQFTTPTFANIISKPFKRAKKYLKNSRQETIIDIKDYLTEEKKILISQNEVNVFYHQVQELKQSVDRLEAKLNLLC